jgi:hypothetical protein
VDKRPEAARYSSSVLMVLRERAVCAWSGILGYFIIILVSFP